MKCHEASTKKGPVINKTAHIVQLEDNYFSINVYCERGKLPPDIASSLFGGWTRGWWTLQMRKKVQLTKLKMQGRIQDSP